MNESNDLKSNNKMENLPSASLKEKLIGSWVIRTPAMLSQAQIGDILEVPLLVLRPSQPAIGREIVARRMFGKARQEDPVQFQRNLISTPFQVIVAPDGTLFLTDGHHRALVAVLKDASHQKPGNYIARVQVKGNYFGRLWRDFLQSTIDANHIYFHGSTLAEFRSRSFPEDEHLRQLVETSIPRKIFDLPDDVVRSLIGDIFFDADLGRVDWFANFFEFRLGEAIRHRLGDVTAIAERGPDCISDWTCSHINSQRDLVIRMMLEDEGILQVAMDNIVANTDEEKVRLLGIYISKLRGIL